MPRSVIARYSDLDRARVALTALERGGTDVRGAVGRPGGGDHRRRRRRGAGGGYATPAMGEEWVTHDAAPVGPVTVRVTSDSPDEIEKAAAVLGDKDPFSIERAG